MHTNYTFTKQNGKITSIDTFELIADTEEEVEILSVMRLQLYYGQRGDHFHYDGPIGADDTTGAVKGIRFATRKYQNEQRRARNWPELPV